VSIPEHVIEDIKNRSSILEIASEFVQLRRSGQNYVGLCPFHSEKTPSFTVRDEQATFHCFGCGKHGTVFTLLMELRGMTFPESVRYLGRRIGIEVPEDGKLDSKHDEAERRRRAAARAVCFRAAEAYRNSLGGSRTAQDYLRGRGLRDSTLERFQVGFAPESWDFIYPAVAESVREQTGLGEEALRSLMEELGLIKRRSDGDGDSFDVFRGRIMFPIARSDGAPIAFGGRILPQSDGSRSPKYLNSCESLLYSKRQTLYGIPQAVRELRSKRHALLVEGYMDVLGLSQAGIENALATCGTAVADQHAALLRRFVERVSIVFDGDTAGTKAAAHCFEVFLNSGLDCFAVSLPEGEDPDTLAGKLGPERLAQFLEESKEPLFDVFLRHLIAEITAGDALSPTSTGKIAVRLAQLLGRVKNSVEREFLLRRSAERLGATVQALETLIRSEARQPSGNRPARSSARVSSSGPVPSPNDPSAQRATSRTDGPAAAAEIKPPRHTRVLRAFYHQLLIAVISEPSLCRELLQLSTFADDPAAGMIMPRKLRSFLEALDVRLQGAGDDWDRPFPGELSEGALRALLAEHGFLPEPLMAEARAQMTTKGTSPQEVVRTAPRVQTRQRLRQEIEKLRADQRGQDPEYLLKIAQEKLEKRRSLDRLQRS
jgi:DNA primase